MEPFKLVGLRLEGKTKNAGGQSGIDCGNLWQQFEKGNIAAKVPGKMGDEIYAVYHDYDGDHTAPFAYFIGCKVPADAEAPEGLSSLSIPAQSYTMFTAKGPVPDCIGDAWRRIWTSDTDRAYQYDFEVYDHRSKDWSNGEIDIFISTRQ